MHTSTVTVAVLDPEVPTKFVLNEQDVDIVTTRGTGPGGQHRNRTESCVVATHKATGLKVRVDMRSQHQSKAMALKILAARLEEAELNSASAGRSAERRQQVGSGMRADKVRTYSTARDSVVDHRTGDRWTLTQWMRGDW